MASVLSFPHSTPFGAYNYDRPIYRSLSSLNNRHSDDTNRHGRHRQLSISSVVSGASRLQNSVRRAHYYHSRPLSPLRGAREISPDRRSVFSDFSLQQSLAPSAFSESAAPGLHYEPSFGVDEIADASLCSLDSPDGMFDADEKDTDSGQDVWYESAETTDESRALTELSLNPMIVEGPNRMQAQAFRRWVSTLRRRKGTCQIPAKSPCLRRAIHSLNQSQGSTEAEDHKSSHRHSDSHVSSLAFVTGVRSASMTMTSMSLPSINAPASARSPRDFRPTTPPVIDEAATRRSQKRARKIQELVRTEEGFVADLKALHHAYFTLLIPHHSGLAGNRSAAQACLGDVLHLHEQILCELQVHLTQLIPYCTAPPHRRPAGRPRLHTAGARLDALSPNKARHQARRQRLSLELSQPIDSDNAEHLCTPQLAADIARVFLNRAKLFNVYEEYGARCEKMQLEVDIQRTSSPSLDHDRALETLQASLLPARGKAQNIKKALGLKDLLIKPVQRITRYELLFKDLCSLTPSCDDPVSHSVLDDALFMISQACHDLNEASGNTERLRALDSQRLLQKRLVFDKQVPIDTIFHEFGRLLLCGCLYVAYRGTTNIKGQYAVCILYESCIVLASAKSSAKYPVLLVAPLATCSVEEPDNGKALQCHTTPHSWKLAFENDGALFEMLCVACSKAEADAWRQQVSGRIAVEKQRLHEGHNRATEIRSPLTDEMRSVGKAYGRACDFRRRSSVQRAATLGPLTELNQVIIKNTQAAGKEGESSSMSVSIPRSQSVITPSHVPVLSPRRSDRIHLEALLLDVWTRDALPLPGLGSKRGEYSVRASAGHVIRKLSMASITSNFSKRSMSYTSISQSYSIDDRSLRSRPKAPAPEKLPKKVAGGKINFHTAPEQFLPEDFDLRNPARARGRLGGLRTITMGIERPRTPFFAAENEPLTTVLKRSRSVVTRRRSGSDVILSPACHQSQPLTPTLEPSVRTNDAIIPSIQEERFGVRQRARSRLAKLLG
ncbi:RhoGEF domain-containing protein 2 [Elsinoe australis]|uniref:RhoGEF domain-containing protein 2 n=1 Tax=Elsinoe australis TaxID=40998 RepID=A0A4U7AWC5_9PEZI|nr:RhoGEF domain-containing protein 2 [Elsinoe australis]